MSDGITPREFIDAILGTLRAAQWTSPIRQIGYREPLADWSDAEADAIRTPALLLSIPTRRVQEDDESAIGCAPRQLRACSCEIHAILSTKTADLSIELLSLAESVMQILEDIDPTGFDHPGQRWGLGDAIGEPEDIEDGEGDLRGGLHGYDSRVIAWTQVIECPRTVVHAPDIPAVLLTSDGCYVETADGCLLTSKTPKSETTIELIPEPA